MNAKLDDKVKRAKSHLKIWNLTLPFGIVSFKSDYCNFYSNYSNKDDDYYYSVSKRTLHNGD